jgi:hypothetical protein
MAQTKLNVAYLKTLGANTFDILRVGSTGNVEFSQGITYANTQIIAGSSNYTSYNLQNSGASNINILVSIEGLVQIPGVDYYVSGQTLTLTSPPDTNANIEIRYMGAAAVTPSVPITSMDILSSFLLMGA